MWEGTVRSSLPAPQVLKVRVVSPNVFEVLSESISESDMGDPCQIEFTTSKVVEPKGAGDGLASQVPSFNGENFENFNSQNNHCKCESSQVPVVGKQLEGYLCLGSQLIHQGVLDECLREVPVWDVASKRQCASEVSGCVVADESALCCSDCEYYTLGLESNPTSEPAWMLKHQLQGHPYDSRCWWCVQGKLRKKRALRQLPGSKELEGGGTVKFDLSGPHSAGVTGSTWFMASVHIGSGWGHVGLQRDKSSASSLVSLQDMLVRLKADSKGKAECIVHYHHDDDKSFRGVVANWIREQKAVDTHTGGYNPNSNAAAEVRIGMLKQKFRVVLLCATGGIAYYEQLWDVGVLYCNRVLNRFDWATKQAPIARLTGEEVPASKYDHVFGAYCLFLIPVENRDGAFRPTSEMGIWVGIDDNCPGGHLVCPIEWDSKTGLWIVYPVVTSTTVKVYDRVFPLRMGPKAGSSVSAPAFEEFVERCFNPIKGMLEQEEVELDQTSQSSSSDSESEPHQPDQVEQAQQPAQVNQPAQSRSSRPGNQPVVSENSDYDSSEGEQQASEGNPYSDECEVECIIDKRVHKGVTQYRVKWLGWNRRYNCWKDADELSCDELVQEYNDSLMASTEPGDECLLLYDVSRSELAFSMTDYTSRLTSPLPDLDVLSSVSRLMGRQSLEGKASDFVPGYVNELNHMIDRRLQLIEGDQEDRVRSTSQVVSLRMILEHKKDGRKKARLVLQGFKEPIEWDLESNVTPVAHQSTIRSLVFMGGKPDDILSSIDVSVAFLQADKYKPGETPRYVSYKPHAGGRDYLFRLLGPIYGQRSAPRAWYKTVIAWMVGEMGYVQGFNEPCVFVHPTTGHRVVLFCDDFLCRGSRQVSEDFYSALARRFDCKDPTYLELGETLTFTGMDISMIEREGKVLYRIDQARDIIEFLEQKGMSEEKVQTSPMPNRKLLCNKEEINSNLQTWCRSVIGGLHYFARGVRYDIAHAISRISQTDGNPTQGTVDALHQLAGYLRSTVDFDLVGIANPGANKLVAMCDSNHHGDADLTTLSQSGFIVCLNGVPVHWRSNRQPKTTNSPVESEVYALSVGCKDLRLMGWVLEDMGVSVDWPMRLGLDSIGAKSFKEDTCPTSKLRGCFDYREKWVRQLKEDREIVLYKVTDSENISDVFTKCMGPSSFAYRINQIRNMSGVEN